MRSGEPRTTSRKISCQSQRDNGWIGCLDEILQPAAGRLRSRRHEFHNAIQAILKNPNDPAFAPYAKNLYSAGVALQWQRQSADSISDRCIFAARSWRLSIQHEHQWRPDDGDQRLERLKPGTATRTACSVLQARSDSSAGAEKQVECCAARCCYVPQIGADGAGATYLANQSAVAQALADGPADFADRWSAVPASAASGGPARSFAALPGDVSQVEAGKKAAIRPLVRVPVAGEGQTAFDVGAPAVPLVPSASIPSTGRPAAFDERFPASSPPAAAPSAAARPLSPFSGQPMRYLPPSVLRVPDNSDVPETDFNDWLAGRPDQATSSSVTVRGRPPQRGGSSVPMQSWLIGGRFVDLENSHRKNVQAAVAGGASNASASSRKNV
ncbi:hypothetical protein ACVILK_002228 [Bradyrhizobium embrapense]